MLAVLSGGTGTPKLLQGLIKLLRQEELSVIVNTGEDLEVSDLHVSPDLDTVIYTLVNIVNEETWYGIRNDTFACHEFLNHLGEPEILRIGDRDRAIKLRRTLLLKRGVPLSQAIRELCSSFGVRTKVMPMSDDRVQTCVETTAGIMNFHEFWVVRRAADEVLNVTFEGAEKARAAPGVLEALDTSDAIIIGPSNPVTSIGPILAIKEIHEALVRNREKVVAVSPIIGNAAVSGPAGALMHGLKYDVSPLGVARIYQNIIGRLLIDLNDEQFAREIEELGIKVSLSDLMMPDLESRVKLARAVLSIVPTR